MTTKFCTFKNVLVRVGSILLLSLPLPKFVDDLQEFDCV